MRPAKNQQRRMLRHLWVVSFLATVAWALLSGCERSAQHDASTAPSSGAKPPGAETNESAGPTKTEPGSAELVQISGGRFMMGDKDEIDATPHEVVVSS